MEQRIFPQSYAAGIVSSSESGVGWVKLVWQHTTCRDLNSSSAASVSRKADFPVFVRHVIEYTTRVSG
jgi:hypothetical protein